MTVAVARTLVVKWCGWRGGEGGVEVADSGGDDWNKKVKILALR